MLSIRGSIPFVEACLGNSTPSMDSVGLARAGLVRWNPSWPSMSEKWKLDYPDGNLGRKFYFEKFQRNDRKYQNLEL